MNLIPWRNKQREEDGGQPMSLMSLAARWTGYSTRSCESLSARSIGRRGPKANGCRPLMWPSRRTR